MTAIYPPYPPFRVDTCAEAYSQNSRTRKAPDTLVTISDGSNVWYFTKEQALAFAAEVVRQAVTLSVHTPNPEEGT